MKSTLTILFLFTLTFLGRAQSIPLSDNPFLYPFLRHQPNEISRAAALDSFYAKLYRLKTTGEGKVSIVHIGDSHLQAGFLTAPLRKRLQAFFGNAGRGLVFPYQLARSNAPTDISCSSNVSWQYNRLAHPEIALQPGIAGFCIQSAAPNATIRMTLKPDDDTAQTFTTIRFFTGNATDTSWFIGAGNNEKAYMVSRDPQDTLPYNQLVLDQPASSFSLTPSGTGHRFYGASLERAESGLLYHTIGVNGATYDQYNKASLFWEQLPALQADLYIISLGTNEAQRKFINQQDLSDEARAMIHHLKAISPDAAILITSPADSYFGGRSLSNSMKEVSSGIAAQSSRNGWAFWDLYNITGGYGSARSWERNKLMSHDRIHYVSPGYQLQGNLLFHALAEGYNAFIGRFNYPLPVAPPKTAGR